LGSGTIHKIRKFEFLLVKLRYWSNINISKQVFTEEKMTILLKPILKVDHPHLYYRRQFFIGPESFTPTPDWRSVSLEEGLTLSVHPDLDFTYEQFDNRQIIVLGLIVDPLNAEKSSQEVINTIGLQTESLGQVIDSTYALGGRWLIIYKDSSDFMAFTDPCGFRQFYYFENSGKLWCGSQPEIIRANTDLELSDDRSLQTLLASQAFKNREGAFVGARTRYRDCYHLMPNHYFDFTLKHQVRFYPKRPLPDISIKDAVATVAPLLKGTIKALYRRFPVMFAVTAGWDTRALLAAIRGLSRELEYYVDRMGILHWNHPDIRIPKKLCKALELTFRVDNSTEELPAWFFKIIEQNVTGVRNLPKTRAIYYRFLNYQNAVNINGNGSEVCRNIFNSQNDIDESTLTPEKLATIFGYEDDEFTVRECERLMDSLKETTKYGFRILDIFFWEHQTGNWGAMFPAEEDIALEEVSPFNNRLIIETLLSVNPKYRIEPDYLVYRELIRSLWPEVLSMPINPPLVSNR